MNSKEKQVEQLLISAKQAENLLSKREMSLPHNFANSLTNHLRKRITLIVEDSIELDRLR